MGTILALIAAGVVIFYVRAYIMPTIRTNNLKKEYQNLHEPILFLQAGESDQEFWSRVSRAKARFTDSGNTWAEKQNPVIAIPQHSHFVISWFGKDYPYSTVGMSQMEYLISSLEIYKKLRTEWERQLNVAFGVERVFQAKGHEEYDPEKIW